MSTTDPYLLQQDEELRHGLRPHTLHDHEHAHGHGHDHSQGDGGASPSGSNRLNDFASHILESHDPHDHDHDHDHDHGSHHHVLSFTGEGGVLESQNVGVGVGVEFDTEVENAMRQAMDDGEFQPHVEDHQLHSHEHGVREHEHEQGQGGGETSTISRTVAAPAPATRNSRRNNYAGSKKRKAGDMDDNGDPVDPILLKKENHKEVERKRRTNINEGIDLLVAQINIPDLEKQGKGVQLRRAVEYVAELDERIMGYEKEVHDLRKEKQDLEANLALTSQRYTEENERCTRYETMWRDAQDREAKSQFDIAQLLDELAQLRRRMGEGER